MDDRDKIVSCVRLAYNVKGIFRHPLFPAAENTINWGDFNDCVNFSATQGFVGNASGLFNFDVVEDVCVGGITHGEGMWLGTKIC